MTAPRSRLPIRLLATLTIFTAFAGQFWRNLLGWWGFGIIAGLVVIAAVVLLVMARPRLSWRLVPKSLVGFLLFALLSIAWSAYPAASALGVGIQLATAASGVFLALCLSRAELVRTFGVALRWMLALSLAFELWVAVVIGGPLLPFWGDFGDPPYPKAFYWSRGLLLDGGPVEGIFGNRNLFGFVALLAIIVFSVQLAARTVRRGWGVSWLVVAAVSFALTRSTTVILAAVVVAAALGFALWTRRIRPDRRRPVYLTAGGILVVVVAALLSAGPALLPLLGKSEDLTGRLTIWDSVIGLATQRPWFGWGWISYWAPWVEPFAGLAERKGVEYLQAHNAWLDVWLQLGIVGLVLFVALMFSTLWRSWFTAVDRPRHGRSDTEPFTASALLPLLLVAALLAQSLAESRLLIEGGWMMLVAICLITKRAHSSGAATGEAYSPAPLRRAPSSPERTP